MADKFPSLNVLSGPLAGHKLVIEDAVDNILIGSDPSCGFVLDTPGVSPIHARLWIDLNGATIYDTSSPTGVYVNDDRVVKEAPVRNGDILWLGPPGADGSVLIQCILAVPEASAPASPSTEPVEPVPVDTGATMAFAVPAFLPDEPEFPPPAADADLGDIDSTVVMSSSALMGHLASELAELEPAANDPSTDATMLLDGSEGLEIVDEPTAAIPPPVAAPPAVPPAAVPRASMPKEAAPVEDTGGFPDFDVEPTFGLAPPPLPPRAMAAAPAAPAPAEFEDELEPTMADAPALVIVAPPQAAAPLPPPVPDRDLSLNDDEDAATVMYHRTDASVLAPPPLAPPAAPPPARTPPVAASAPPQAAPAPVVPRPPKIAAPMPSAPPRPPVEARPPAEARPSPRVTPPAPTPPAPTPPARPPAPAARPRAEPPPAPPDDSTAPIRPLRGGGSGKGPLIAAAAVVVAALAFAAYWFTRPTASPVAEATSIPAPPVTQAAPPAAAEPPPATEAAAPPDTLPPPVAEATPIPVAPAVVRSPPPSPRVAAAAPVVPPRQRPGTVTPGQRPPVAATAPPASGATPAQQAAAAVANLMAQAKAAADAKNYDAAVSMYDQVLKLEPQNGPAGAGRTAAVAARAASRKTFVAGRTVVQTEQKSKGSLSGFDSADVVQKNPDFLGRLELAMNPANVKPGDPYRLQIALVNEGKKPIKISGMTFTITVNGQKSGNPIAPKVKEVAPSQRAVLEDLPGVFPAAANSWTAEVLVTANKGDSLKNQITWK